VFANASLQAYGAVAFICNNNQVSFVMGKSRLTPLKQLSLPKLELMVALIAARLSKIYYRNSPFHEPHPSPVDRQSNCVVLVAEQQEA